MNEKIVDDCGAAEEPGLRDRPVRQEPPGRPKHMLPTNHGFDEFYGNLYHLNAEEEPEMYDYFPEEEFGKFIETVRPRGVIHSFATDVDDPTGATALGQGGKAEDQGHGSADTKRMLTCDDDFAEKRQGLYQESHGQRQAFLRVGQLHSHAPVHAHQEGKPGTGRALAVAVPRHDDRPRQERRALSSITSTSWALRRTRWLSTRPTMARTATHGRTVA